MYKIYAFSIVKKLTNNSAKRQNIIGSEYTLAEILIICAMPTQEGITPHPTSPVTISVGLSKQDKERETEGIAAETGCGVLVCYP